MSWAISSSGFRALKTLPGVREAEGRRQGWAVSGGESAESSRETTCMARAESHSEEPEVLSVTVRGKVAVRTQSTRDSSPWAHCGGSGS